MDQCDVWRAGYVRYCLGSDVYTGWIKSKPAGSPSLPLTIKLFTRCMCTAGSDLLRLSNSPVLIKLSLLQQITVAKDEKPAGASQSLCLASSSQVR